MKTYEGQLTTSKDEKFCIIISRFNDFIGSKLLSGAIDELRRHGVDEENIEIVKVPGAFEQAIERAGTKAGNKGADAAKTAIEMANLVKLV